MGASPPPHRGGLLRYPFIATLFWVGCAPADPADPVPEEAVRFVADRAFRRSTLESQLVSTANAYGYERLRSYALEDPEAGWNALPVEPLAVAAGWPDEVLPDDLQGLLDLGERAFFEYPARVGAEFAPGVTHLPTGIAATPYAREAEDGSGRAIVTCATCHVRGGVVGAANTSFDVGAVYAEAFELADGDEGRQRFLSWGPGRMDVTADTADDPVRFADLRALASQPLLQSAGAVRHRTPSDLAVRLDTLIIGSSGRRTRPALATIVALAWWLDLRSTVDDEVPTHDLFDAHCARCHQPAHGYASAEPIPVEEVGTDDAAAWSPGRGTGGYKAPSLRRLAGREPLLHDASVPDLETLLDPERRRGGHTFTGGLSVGQVRALIEFLLTL